MTRFINLKQISIIIVPLLISVAYFTPAERKILGAIQMSIGPSLIGILKFLKKIRTLPYLVSNPKELYCDVYTSALIGVDSLEGIIFSPVEPSILSSFSMEDLGWVLYFTCMVGVMCYSGYRIYYSTPVVNSTPDDITPIGSPVAVSSPVGDLDSGTIPHLIGVKANGVIGSSEGYTLGIEFYKKAGQIIMPADLDSFGYCFGYATAYREMQSNSAGLRGFEISQYDVGYQHGQAALAEAACTMKTASVFGFMHGFHAQQEAVSKKIPVLSYDRYASSLRQLRRVQAEAASQSISTSSTVSAEVPSSAVALDKVPNGVSEIPANTSDFSSKVWELFAKVSDFVSSFFPPGA